MQDIKSKFYSRTRRLFKKNGVKKYDKIITEVRREMEKFPEKTHDIAVLAFMLFMEAQEGELDLNKVVEMFKVLPNFTARATKLSTLGTVVQNQKVYEQDLRDSIIKLYRNSFTSNFSEEKYDKILYELAYKEKINEQMEKQISKLMEMMENGELDVKDLEKLMSQLNISDLDNIENIDKLDIENLDEDTKETFNKVMEIFTSDNFEIPDDLEDLKNLEGETFNLSQVNVEENVEDNK